VGVPCTGTAMPLFRDFQRPRRHGKG
jgi:hypothetical protein